MQQLVRLKGCKPAGEDHQGGSLHNIVTSANRIPGHSVGGGRMREIFVGFLDECPGLVERLCATIGSEVGLGDVLPDADLADLRRRAISAATNMVSRSSSGGVNIIMASPKMQVIASSHEVS